MEHRGVRPLSFYERRLAVVVAQLAVSLSSVFADDLPIRVEAELFPQSAKIARDRRSDTVLDSARTHLKRRDFAAAISQLQALLDEPNSFAAGGATSRSLHEEANRLLAELPSEGREAYERLHGPEAQRLWQEARRSGRPEYLRRVVERFGQTIAGWQALRDLAAWHSDRGEQHLSAAASESLSRHAHSTVTSDVNWIARWVLAVDRPRANQLLARYRVQLENVKAPVATRSKDLATWLENQLRSRSVQVAKETPLPNDLVASGPSSTPSWRYDLELEGEPADLFQKIVATWKEEDVLAIPSAQMLAVDDVVIARFLHPSKVIAVDARQSKLLWERSTTSPLNSAAADLQRHPIIRQPLLDELQQRWFGDSVRGRMTSDGKRLFLVTDLDDLDLKPGAGSRLRNHLEAWDMASGERLWRVGTSANQSPTGLEGQYFLSPPLIRDRMLYVIAQRESRVALWALRADDGRVEWTIPLAETDRQQFKETHWRHVACPVTWSAGKLVCPTGAGCLVAVDPVTRSLSWSLRFERQDINSAINFGAGDRDRPFPERWWESWREVFLVEGSNLLVATPESRSLRALEARSGDVRWQMSFDEPMFLATSSSAVLVFERHLVTGLNPNDGTVLWRTRLSSPTGIGDWTGDAYVCPSREGWAAFDSRNGSVRWSASPFQWPEKDVTKNNSVRSVALASSRLQQLGSRWAVQTPVSFGLFDSVAAHSVDHIKLESDILKLSRGTDKQFSARTTITEAAHQSGDTESVLLGLLDLLDLHPEGEITVLDGDLQRTSARTVRKDRWIQGQIADLLAKANAEQQATLNSLLTERRRQAFESPDAFALQSLAEQWSCLPLGRELRLSLSGRTGIGLGYLRTSLALREIAFGNDRPAAAEAWHRLALLYDFRSEPLEAADCYRELRDHFSEVKRADGSSSAEWLADVMADSRIGRLLANGPADPWPTRQPIITRTEEKHDDIYCHLIPIESRDPFWQRMTVSLERQGKKVRFHGAGQRGYWEAPLPPSNGIFRHAYNMFRGWGIGPLLILQVGTELFGVQVLDDRGETNAKVLWSLMVNDADTIIGNDLRMGRLGISNDDLMPLDRSEQPLLEVVHGSPGLLCYRTRRRLIAVDPMTGSMLWMRQELPPRVNVTSDGEFAILKLLEQKSIEVRRAFDGKLLATRLDDADSPEILFHQGRHRLRLSAGNGPKDAATQVLAHRPSSLIYDDLATGQPTWQHDLVPQSAPLRIDESRVGVLEPGGALRFLSLNDGHELAQHNVSMPKTLSQFFAFGDSLRLFVIIAGPVTERNWLATEQDRAYRKPLANGWLHAFDRRTLAKLWTIPASNLPIALDQPKDIPFLLLGYRRPSDDSADGQNSDGVLHAIDKRTGKELHYDVGGVTNVYFAIEPNPQERQIDVLSKNHRIRFDFNEPQK